MTTPGIYTDLDEATYHADPALSASGAKRLLPPGCPALYKWERDHGQPQRAAFDFGRAAHALVLGVGSPLRRIDADDWRSKTARELRDAAYADGLTPVLEKEWAQITGMADAIRAHPIAAALLHPDGGQPEASLFWRDDRHGVDRRARLDWLPATDGGRMIVPDLKTTTSAEPAAFARAAFNFGYPLQAAYYLDGIRAHGLAEDPAFVLIAVEKTAPYLVTVFEFDGDALRIGHEQTQRALATFAECLATDTWPPYSSDVELIAPPAWLARQYESVL